MTDSPDKPATEVPPNTRTTAPAGAPVPINEDNRSDGNDGVKRPLGYYSSQAQADRNGGHAGETETNEAAGGPGFYSPEQQAARELGDS
jgi:hypothetical protein